MQGHKGLMHRIKAVDPEPVRVRPSLAYHVRIHVTGRAFPEDSCVRLTDRVSKCFQVPTSELLARIEPPVPFEGGVKWL